jgi:hypothetical protein
MVVVILDPDIGVRADDGLIAGIPNGSSEVVV